MLLTDLAEGNWTIKAGKKTVRTADVHAESGTLYFDASPGIYSGINRR